MRRILVGGIVVAFALVACAGIGAAAWPEWWKKAAEPYAGQTIKAIGQSTPPSEVIRDVIAADFEKLTGIKVDFEAQPWEVEYEKVIRDVTAGTGLYDLAYIEQDAIYAFMKQGWLADLTELMEDHPELTDPDLDIDDFTKFIEYFRGPDNGHLYGLPFEAFLKMYIYRTDLFNDPEIKEAFKSEYGWELRPAKNWTEFRQIAEFFTAWGEKKGIDLYGFTAQAKTGYPALPYEIVETIWPAWGIYNWGINLDTWGASVAKGGEVNSDRAKEALQYYVDMLEYCPPGVKTYTWDEEAASFAAGKVAQSFIYCEFLGSLISVPEKSKVVGKYGITVSPTRGEAMNDAVRGMGYIGYYDGASYSIPWCSNKKEAAWLFSQFIVRKDFAVEYTRRASRVVRESTFLAPEIGQLNEEQGGYFDAFQKYESLYAGAAPLPMHLVIIDIYMDWISKAVAKELTVDEALEGLAAEIDETMVELGY